MGLSNIEKYHLNKKNYLNNKNKENDKPTVPNDLEIVETVEVPDEIREHCTVQYKFYVDKALPRNAKGWRIYNLRCNYCNSTVRSANKLIDHLKTCKGLDDDYVKKPRRPR